MTFLFAAIGAKILLESEKAATPAPLVERRSIQDGTDRWPMALFWGSAPTPTMDPGKKRKEKGKEKGVGSLFQLNHSQKTPDPLLPSYQAADGAYHGLLATSTPIPEPSTLPLLGVGVLGIIGYAWRKRGAAHSVSA